MELEGQRVLPIDRERAWRALNDPALIQAAIPGCESMEKVGDNEYRIMLTASLGPMRTNFHGRLHVEDIDAPRSYTLRFEGDGFLYKMVRLVTGTLVRCAQGRAELSFIEELLAAKGARKTSFAAPAEGLYLARVLY